MNDTQREFLKTLIEKRKTMRDAQLAQEEHRAKIENAKSDRSKAKWIKEVEQDEQIIGDLRDDYKKFQEKAIKEFSTAHDLMMYNKAEAKSSMGALETAKKLYEMQKSDQLKRLARWERNIANFLEYKIALYPYVYGREASEEDKTKEAEALQNILETIKKFEV